MTVEGAVPGTRVRLTKTAMDAIAGAGRGEGARLIERLAGAGGVGEVRQVRRLAGGAGTCVLVAWGVGAGAADEWRLHWPGDLEGA
jgi:hypothetical protein